MPILKQVLNGPRTFIEYTLIIFFISFIIGGCSPVPKKYEPPGKTSWAPVGARTVPSLNEKLGNPAGFWRTMHADTLNSDEVAIAVSPVYEAGWIAEPNMYIPEGPTFDKSGNLYFCPVFPEEDVFMVSLEPNTGTRRWSIPGRSDGAGAPLVLDDPDNFGEQIIYLGSYDRAIAVRPDKTLIWDKPTGIPDPLPDSTPGDLHVYGVNYDPTTDSIIGLSGGGHIYVLDRETGDQLLSEPFVLPGEKSPPEETVTIPDFLLERMDNAVAPLLGGATVEPGYSHSKMLFDICLGNELKVANYFSIDPHTGRLWVGATAPDAEDGEIDGISQLGALYCLKLVENQGDSYYTIEEQFHTAFAGGTATTPALSADGSRIYMGDNFGKLFAIDAADGDKLWEIDVDNQIFGSISVASDNNELYAVTTDAVIKVIDKGDYGEEIWRSELDMYSQKSGVTNQNLCLAAICANGISFQASGSVILGDLPQMPLSLGVGLLDRETGKLRYFAEGREESISMTPVGPDGSVYIAHSPMRRILSVAMFGNLVPPLTGGIQKYAAKRLDLLIRDAIHAAADRAKNVSDHLGSLSESVKEVEIKHIGMLINQCRLVSTKAIENGDLSSQLWTQIDNYLSNAESALLATTPNFGGAYQNLNQADNLLPDQ